MSGSPTTEKIDVKAVVETLEEARKALRLQNEMSDGTQCTYGPTARVLDRLDAQLAKIRAPA